MAPSGQSRPVEWQLQYGAWAALVPTSSARFHDVRNQGPGAWGQTKPTLNPGESSGSGAVGFQAFTASGLEGLRV